MNILISQALSQTVFSRTRWLLGFALVVCVAIQAAERADKLFGKYSQEIKRLSHSIGVDGNPPDGYRELAPLITEAAKLKPDNPEILLSAIYCDVILDLYKDSTVDEMITKYQNYITATEEFERNFPDWPKRLYKASRPNVRVTLLNNVFDIGRRFKVFPALSWGTKKK